MLFKIEFVFLTEPCQGLKLSLLDSQWRKKIQMSQLMQLEIDQKVTLKVDNVDTECVLLKNGTPAAMAVEYESPKLACEEATKAANQYDKDCRRKNASANN